MVDAKIIKLIDELKTNISISRICEVLKISRGTYYYNKKRLKQFKLNNIENEIKQLCIKTKFLYGYRKIYALLQQKQVACSVSKVQRIMNKYGWNCKIKPKKLNHIGSPYKQFDNLINRDWKAKAPLKKLTTDITYIPCGNKFLDLSPILDTFISEIVAYEISELPNKELALDTLKKLDNIEETILH